MKTKAFSVYDFVDTLVWLLIGFAPLIFYGIALIHAEGSLYFSTFVSNEMGININSESVIYSSLRTIFGEYFDFFVFDSGHMNFLDFFVWFVYVGFAHVFVDFILFIPRMAHGFMDGFRRKIT